MISVRAILILILVVAALLAVRAPGVWLYDVIAYRLRGRQPASPQPEARVPGQPAAAARAEQVRQPG